MNLIELFGPWLIVVVMALAILRRVESAIWVHKSQLDTLIAQTEKLIDQYEVRLTEQRAAIERQHQILVRNSRVADSSASIATALVRAQEGGGGE